MSPVRSDDMESADKAPITNGYHHDASKHQAGGPGAAEKAMRTERSASEVVGKPEADAKLLFQSLKALYSSAIDAKIWYVASVALTMTEPPSIFPEYTRSNGKCYVYRDREFWTSGFFPGTLHELMYRSRKFPAQTNPERASAPHPMKLKFACEWWTENLHSNAAMTTTHDLGFMIMPWARPAWELNHDTRAFETLKLAANSLLSRFSPTVGLIRSWDVCITARYSFQTPNNEFLTVIDNMMNLDLLFYAASHTKNQEMWDAAVQHARTTQNSHIRPDHSTVHLVVFEPATGAFRENLTNQGYDDDSCWTRGQAWAIAGFAETYGWTRDLSFLETAQNCSEYFLARLPASFIPPWDFDAALNSDESQPPDTSAAMIAAYGLLLIHKALVGLADFSKAQKYLEAALRITAAVCETHADLSAHATQSSVPVETVEQGVSQMYTDTICNSGGDTILTGATINNYRFAPRRWADHGLVYADYYFMRVGNLLLDMGLDSM